MIDLFLYCLVEETLQVFLDFTFLFIGKLLWVLYASMLEIRFDKLLRLFFEEPLQIFPWQLVLVLVDYSFCNRPYLRQSDTEQFTNLEKTYSVLVDFPLLFG